MLNIDKLPQGLGIYADDDDQRRTNSAIVIKVNELIGTIKTLQADVESLEHQVATLQNINSDKY